MKHREPYLRATDLVRLATRSTNKMLAGSRVKVIGDSTQELTDMLTKFGAIVTESPLDFVFIVGDTESEFNTHREFVARLWKPATDTPTVIVTSGNQANLLTRLCQTEGVRPAEHQQRTELVELEDALGHRLAVAVAAHADQQTDGHLRMEWALRAMPATRALLNKHSASIAGTRITVSLLLEPKTAALVAGLHRAGAEVTVFAPASETDPSIARALHDLGVRVCAPKAGIVDEASHSEHSDELRARESLAHDPEYLIDDGAHLIRLAHTEFVQALSTLKAAAEETTSGVRPLIEMSREGNLTIPVIAVNNARTKTLFDNRIGTGESCLMAIAEDIDLTGKNCVIFGYGPVGQGCARAAAALGCRVSIIDPDPVAVLQALTDGREIGNLDSADVVISATGVWHTITEPHIDAVPDGTVFAVAGGIDEEIVQLTDWTTHDDTTFTRSDGKRVTILAKGAGINYTSGEGNPLEVMDLSFATQVAALADLIHTQNREAGVYEIPAHVEAEIARAALTARGITTSQPLAETRPGGAAQHWTTHRFRLD